MSGVKFFIPKNTPSSKNSKQWTGKFLVHSKTCQTYYKETEKYWIEYAERFRETLKNLPKPYKIDFEFIRDSRRKFDYVNPLQTVLDQMSKYNWIEDDNCEIVLPSFTPYRYDKANAGVIITIKTD